MKQCLLFSLLPTSLRITCFSFILMISHLFTNTYCSDFDVIYGSDDRYETDSYPDALFREKAKSVAGMVKTRALRKDYKTDPENFTTFFKRTASRSHNICNDETFALQNALPICTGFLIAPDILVTAGHCVTKRTPCNLFSWIFGYKRGVTTFPNKDIYKCKEVLSRKEVDSNISLLDYAVIRLERKVEDRAPLEIRQKGEVSAGTPLLTIGHPFGVPQKIFDNARVLAQDSLGLEQYFERYHRQDDYFITNLDTFGGNSGSPVFNLNTGLIEGLLIEGADDFVEDINLGCNRMAHRKDHSFAADEQVLRINRVKY